MENLRYIDHLGRGLPMVYSVSQLNEPKVSEAKYKLFSFQIYFAA
ncbi:MAG: hypothetical protein VSS75_025645 [Candidatus Parabeggiatoa sp.]|nr:hypothetical protein [Candidatus Parabeggiatoa sp.]